MKNQISIDIKIKETSTLNRYKNKMYFYWKKVKRKFTNAKLTITEKIESVENKSYKTDKTLGNNKHFFFQIDSHEKKKLIRFIFFYFCKLFNSKVNEVTELPPTRK